ncbi:hypothetical protein MJI20_29910, partial [Salmonella enterica subsp. enterica serovar Anatum]|nr:hypothetical protein [Salmonella enterica subsp. enterica serovar Anatum]
MVRWLRGHLRMTDTIENEHFFVRKNGLLYATPLLLVLTEILLEGLRRLEYRGYDSAGLAVVDAEGHMTRLRRLGKVQMLA